MAKKVYFTVASASEPASGLSEKARALFRAGDFERCFAERDFTAVKIHVGEGPNDTYVKAPCLSGLIEEVRGLGTRPFLADTSCLYTGRRHNAIDHAILASEHGFDAAGLGIPFISPDGLFGTSETAVEINCPLNHEVFIATDIVRCQSILSIAHFTGHPVTGAAATIKTLGMGCASRKGKRRQHASIKPSVKNSCTLCGDCVRYCPVDAIVPGEKKAEIDNKKCIGCGECLAVCRFDAVSYDWGADGGRLQKNVAEHALGALKGKVGRAAFFSFLINITADCDCFDRAGMKPIVPDIGILASGDPVAVDAAAISLVEEAGGDAVGRLAGHGGLDSRVQIEHAQAIGLGSADFEIVRV